MTQMNTFADPVAGIQSALRGTAPAHPSTWACHLCGESSQGEVELWIHAKEMHQDSTEVTGSGDELKAKKQRFLQRAQYWPATNKAENEHSLKAPSINDSTNVYIGEDIGQHSAPVSQASGTKLDDAQYPMAEQWRLTQQQEMPMPANIPRIRVFRGDVCPPKPAKQTYKIGSIARSHRHTQTPCGSFFTDTDPSLIRQHTLQDPELIRDTIGSTKPLWDSQVDLLSRSRTHRRTKAKDQGHTNIGRRRQNQTNRQHQHSPPDHDQDRTRMQYHRCNIDRTTTQPVTLGLDQNPPFGRFPLRKDTEADPEMLLQPEPKLVPREQLVVDLKTRYAGLVILEAKCINIHGTLSAAGQETDPLKRTKLNVDQWQSLIALHKELLGEHLEFFLTSQHPSGSPSLSGLAAKHSLPTRMWRHGIHAFLEVMRHRLPESLEYMLAFIYIAYPILTQLSEVVSTYEVTWIECLGDLSRYRMAIEDDEPKDREVWRRVARFWYCKALDKTPNIGRLYHHLAILANPYTFEQLSLYARSISCVTPFEAARESIMMLFDPVSQSRDNSSPERICIRAHAILFTSRMPSACDRFDLAVDEFEKDGLFHTYIAKAGARFKKIGAFAAISNIAALFGYPTEPGIRLAYENAQMTKDAALNLESSNLTEPKDPFGLEENIQMDFGQSLPQENEMSSIFITQPSRLASVTLEISLNRTKDQNVYPLVYIYLVFIWSLIVVQKSWKPFETYGAWRCIEKDIPWFAICAFLNNLARRFPSKNFAQDFPGPSEEKARPLPEDFLLRGQLYSQGYFPSTWFTNSVVDNDEQTSERPSTAQPRMERILWLGHRIALANRWIRFNVDTESFVATDYVLKIQAKPEPLSTDPTIAIIDASTT